jgi:membrane fusion protein, multidrug efflux system
LTQPRSRWPFAAALILIAVAGYFGWRHFHSPGTAAANVGKTPVPVTVTEARTADFPVYMHGLGTVQPYDTVTVRSRVDGEVLSVGFKQGQTVEEGQVLVQIDPRPYQAALDQAVAKKAQDAANLRNAQLNLARYGALASQDFASRQQFDTQQASVQELMAQIQGDQAMIDNEQTQVSYTTIKSPLTGRVGFRLVDPGNIVHAADTTGIVTIVKLQPISVVFTAPEERVPDINQALAAGTVPVNALSTDGTKTLAEGRLAFVNNEVDQASGTIRMKASFENKDNVLWPGLSVSTRLLLETLKQAVVVPDEAIGRGPDGLYAFVVDPGNKLVMRTVKVTREEDGQSAIAEGLSPGEKVVISGQYNLEQGALVDPKDAGSVDPKDAGSKTPPAQPAGSPTGSNTTAQAH